VTPRLLQPQSSTSQGAVPVAWSFSKAINGLAQQMQIVARTISASIKPGVRRQVLFVSLSGFDTHDAQNRS
jgi:uncharacterized protein (DUF1501 family)